MNLLLDSHALLWWLESEDPRLPSSARDAVAAQGNSVTVSAASVWELCVKQGAGRLEIGGNLLAEIAANGFQPLPISLEHGSAAGRLPLHHRDPFDRMLVAQAQIEGLTIVTHDRKIGLYDVPVLWD
ncbi:MAG: type II toxin-antitoxin system VapC family toxin [Acidimicrobiales bacterium]